MFHCHCHVSFFWGGALDKNTWGSPWFFFWMPRFTDFLWTTNFSKAKKLVVSTGYVHLSMKQWFQRSQEDWGQTHLFWLNFANVMEANWAFEKTFQMFGMKTLLHQNKKSAKRSRTLANQTWVLLNEGTLEAHLATTNMTPSVAGVQISTNFIHPNGSGSKWSDAFSAALKTHWPKSKNQPESFHDMETKRSGTPKKPHIFCGGSSKNLPDLYWSPAQLGSGSCLTSKKIKAMRNLKSKPRQNRPPLGYVFSCVEKKPPPTLYTHTIPTWIQLGGWFCRVTLTISPNRRHLKSEQHWQHRDDEDVVLKKESAKVNTVGAGV